MPLSKLCKPLRRCKDVYMSDHLNSTWIGDPIDRVDGRLKVTGAAKYAAEYEVPGLTYGVLVSATVAKGRIKTIDTGAAERAPGVLSVITHLNAPKVPGYDEGANPAKGPTKGKGLRIFNSDRIFFNGQPIALVIADTFERALFASSLVKAQYEKEAAHTDLALLKDEAKAPGNNKDYTRGLVDAFRTAPVKIEAEYILPREVHNPMELHAITVVWEGDEKVTVFDKTQGVKATQRSIMDAFHLKQENVQVNAPFVGGAFGSALRTWPHEIAALMGAKKTGRPLKLVLSRDQMFMLVGYRPYTWQRIGLGATPDGKLVGITHEAIGETSSYEDFTEGTVAISKALYACPNVTTKYKIVPVDLSTPTWMRGPGEATGAFALESAMDELAYALKMDPLEFRLRNYAETDPERNLPFSSKYLREAYQTGAEMIGWKTRRMEPGQLKDGPWLIGYGMGTGLFGAGRGRATVLARLVNDGTALLQTAVTDIGPGTATAMVKIASDLLGLPPGKIRYAIGASDLPDAPTQGGSTIMSTVGPAVYEACTALKAKLAGLAAKSGNQQFAEAKAEALVLQNGQISLIGKEGTALSFVDILNKNDLPFVEVTQESRPNGAERQQYAFYSFSVHFAEVRINPLTGVVQLSRIVTGADSGTIISEKTARSQMVGGVVGGIGMALMEEGVVDARNGRYVNNNFADYHVPVHADVPHIDTFFVNKPDPHMNPTGAKGMGEIALIGFAAAVANAVFNATGKRIRELPITPDKIIVS
jgi:xanthine dehydrogenase YagR molybdenum-binding subunit